MWCGARDSAVLEGLGQGKEWWSCNPSGSRPNFFGRQHLTFDKGGKFSAGQGIVRMRNRISTHRRSPYEKWVG